MTTLDFAPLYRSTVGFDRLAQLLDAVTKPESAAGYPPYDIERLGEDAYRITMAVAGFGRDEIQIESKENVLTVRAQKAADKTERTFLYQGIAARSFERRFHLADHVTVTGADLENGLLHIDLVREVPEAKKPRVIEIGTKRGNGKVLEGSAN